MAATKPNLAATGKWSEPLVKISPSTKIYTDQSKLKGAGRGVFAATDIKAGEVIERCPVVELPPTDPAYTHNSDLTRYFYVFGDGVAVVLGCGLLYNSAPTPNASYQPIVKDRVVEYRALADIKKGQEIVINYHQPAQMVSWGQP